MAFSCRCLQRCLAARFSPQMKDRERRRAMRRALNSWLARFEERRQLLHATAALRHREVFVALNTWRSYARERRVWPTRWP